MSSSDSAVSLTPVQGVPLEASSAYLDSGICARFEGLVRESQTSIFRVAYRLTGDRDEAEDLVQESLVEAFEAFDKFRAGTHFDRWVFRIMRNTFLDGKRRRSKARIDSLEDSGVRELGAAKGFGISPYSADTEIMSRTLDGPIQDALDALPAEFRMVVILADIEGLTYEEVSEVVGRPVGTVRSRLHRGRMILKEKLKSYVRS